eukprot:jgi/Psemu1/2072/gm1.2072_g
MPGTSTQAAEAEVLRESVTLTDFESSAIMGMQRGITTATFLLGKAYPTVLFIRERLRAIIKVNPWLVGNLVLDNNEKNLQFVYPSAEAEVKTALTDSMLDDLIRFDPPNLSIHSKMAYNELRDAIGRSEAQLPKSSALVNKLDMVVRVTIASDSVEKDGAFVIILSTSHAVADGHTHYAIMKMMCEGSDIIPLNPRRDPEVERRCRNVTRTETAYIPSFSSVFSAFWRLVFRPRNEYHAFYVDKARVGVAKEIAKARGANFVSTNDVITSTFGITSNARLCFMAINLRNRVKGARSDDAGNYECILGIDAGFYNHPEKIRQVIQEGPPYVAHTRPFPGFYEAATSTIAVTSNWSSFACELKLPDCEHVIQLPILNCVYDCACIFAPRDDELAVLYGVKSGDRTRLCEVAPLGPNVSDSLFPP